LFTFTNERYLKAEDRLKQHNMAIGQRCWPPPYTSLAYTLFKVGTIRITIQLQSYDDMTWKHVTCNQKLTDRKLSLPHEIRN